MTVDFELGSFPDLLLVPSRADMKYNPPIFSIRKFRSCLIITAIVSASSSLRSHGTCLDQRSWCETSLSLYITIHSNVKSFLLNDRRAKKRGTRLELLVRSHASVATLLSVLYYGTMGSTTRCRNLCDDSCKRYDIIFWRCAAQKQSNRG